VLSISLKCWWAWFPSVILWLSHWPPGFWPWASHFISIAFSFDWGSLYQSVYARTSKISVYASQSFFFQMSIFMCFINLYHMQNILCRGHHSISNILWVITCWNVGLGKLLILMTLGAILRHFWIYFCTLGWVKCIRGASLLFFTFPLFLQFLPGDFGRVFPLMITNGVK
jgi:hypothetical protein